uniref:Cathepsin L7 n=1 Tax=Dysdercus peruvianus TaxID=685034 RepID=A0A7U3NJD4_9HEMI|nr:cathepsin L7 [Dysdercus peruvianus]
MVFKSVLLCIAAVLITATAANPLIKEDRWLEFKNKHGKSYGSDEEELSRKQIFYENLKKIQNHNRLHESGETTFTLKMNKFGDLTTEEFKKLVLGTKIPLRNELNMIHHLPVVDNLPASVDWRPKGAVTAVKDQAACGSCWAFSTTGALEGQLFLYNKSLVSLSEQDLVDCSLEEGNLGCSGGWPQWAFQYISKHGINTENDYPYEAKDYGKCRAKAPKAILSGISFVNLPEKDEKALASAVANIGPISICIDAGIFSFQFYSSGIYYEASCNPNNLDHAVLAVGYGSDGDRNYWIVKNSWGVSWGQKGYILMAKDKNNNCGVASKPSYPII